MTTSRIGTLWRKETTEIIRNIGALVPVGIVGILALVLPFGITIVIPSLTGHALGEDSDLARVSVIMGSHPELTVDGRVQLFLFQQFLIVFLLIPITGAMALASHSVIGEKQARTLEPLLVTPLGTGELLVAKVLGTLTPTIVIAAVLMTLYFIGIATFGEPGVLQGLANQRTAVLVAMVSPASALVALQASIVISSRVNDPRTAQQFGALLILPVSALLVAQFVGRAWLSASALAWIAVGLFAAWILLVLLSIALFDRETILTRWR